MPNNEDGSMPIQRNNDEERADRIDRLVNEHPTDTARGGGTSQEPVGAAGHTNGG